MATISIVSGGGTGIGRAIARGLAADGEQVRILGRRAGVLHAAADAINAELGEPRVASIAIDLTDPAAVGGDGITANVVAPGYVEDTEFFGDAMTDERRAALVGATLDGRPGRPEDVAQAVRFLASPGAAHGTGQVLAFNGGAMPG